MDSPTGPPLETDEMLRVMDVAQVLRERRARFDEREAFDREAVIREVQVIYEGLGDLVEADVIGEALDLYLAERHTFQPPPAGLGTSLATLYVRRGWVARRVMLPVGIVALVGWAGWAGWGWSQRIAVERAVATLQQRLDGAESERRAQVDALNQLGEASARAALTEDEARRYDDRLATAWALLGQAESVPVAADGPGSPPAPDALDQAGARVLDAWVVHERAAAEMDAARALVDGRLRFGSLAEERARLEVAIPALAREATALQRSEVIQRRARAFESADDAANLEAAVLELGELEAALTEEYRIVVTGGRWRYRDDAPDVRNYYLTVQALDTQGQPLPRRITNEETGVVETVTEWGERVPESIYDAVRRDREDNGIIDDDRFGAKRRGFLEPERRHADLGQITRW